MNCTFDKPPNITTFFKEITHTQTIILSVAAVVLAATVIYFVVESVVLIIYKQVSSKYARHMLFVQGTYPAYSVMSFLAIISPLSMQLTELIFAIYFSFTLLELFWIMQHIMEESISDEEQEEKTVSLASPPLACCFFLCCPRVRMTSKFEKAVKIGVYQAIILRPIFIFIEAILWINGYYGYTKVSSGNSVLEALNAACVLVAMYFMIMQYNGNKGILQPHGLRTKFACIQIVMLIASLQPTLFNLLVAKRVIPCKDPFNSAVRGSVINHYVVLLEMVPLMLLSSTLCRKTDRGFDSGEARPLLDSEPLNT